MKKKKTADFPVIPANPGGTPLQSFPSAKLLKEIIIAQINANKSVIISNKFEDLPNKNSKLSNIQDKRTNENKTPNG